MKKILYLALCSLLLAGLIMCFAACGDDEETTGSSSSKPDSSSSSVADSSTESSTTDTSGSSTDSTDSSKDNTETSNDNIGSSSDSTDSSTDSSVPTTDSSDTGSSTESSVPTTDSSTQDPSVDEHEHTYSSEYSYDAQSHYYKATCEHKEEVKDVEPHSFDEKGNCKCGYHQHVYSEEYSYDADNHFNRAICEHTEEIANLEAHSYNEQDVCKCGKTKDVVQDIIALIVANRDKITSGTSDQTSYNNVLNSVSVSNIVYKFYDNYVYVRQEEDYINEYYYSYDDGKLTAIFVQNGTSINVDTEASEDNLAGARYILGCVDQYETFACGSESLLEFFYKNGIDLASNVFVATRNGNEYTMSYGYCIVDDWADYYYQITATFTVEETTGTLANAFITVDRFAKESYTVVDGKYVINDGAEPNFKTTFEITQTTEALENVENPYNSSKILLDSITVKDKEGNDIESTIIKQRADENIKIFLSDITPSTALLSLCEIEIIVKNEADGQIVSIDPFFNSYDNSYTFGINTPGVYEISVRINDMTFVSTAEISAKIPMMISAQVYDAASGLFDKTKKVEAYAGAPLYITSYVESGYDGAYVANVIGENAANAKLTESEISGMAATVFTSDVFGEYIVELVSNADSSVRCQLTVTVVEAPSIEDMLNGEYFANDSYGDRIVSAVFDSDNSIVDVTYAGLYGEEITQISYSVADGKISYEVVDGDEFIDEFYVNELYQVVMVIYDETYVLEQVFVERVLVSSGKMKVEDIAGNGKNSYTYAFELYSTGEFVFFKDYAKTKDVSVTKKNGSYMFKFTGTEAQALVKTSGASDSLAGEYLIENVVKVTFNVDDVAAFVKEPQYGTLEVIDYTTTASDKNKSFVYGYEIIDGEFVFYRYGEVTENVSLTEIGGEYSFKYENLSSAFVMEKVDGADDVLGGKYVIERYMPALVRFAEIVITPGDQGPQKPIIIEEPCGMFMLEDKLEDVLSGTYHYEIIDGAFVIYKDGVLVTDIVITAGENETYYLQCGTLEELTLLNKIEGEEFALAGYYEAYNEVDLAYGITFVPGLLGDEEPTGILEIIDNNKGTFGGTYTYEIIDGAFVIYKDGVVTNDVSVIKDIDGSYLFQCTGIVPQKLVKVEGMSVLLEGTYNVNGETDGVYVLTFTPCIIEKIPVYVEEGTLEITDNNAQTVGGSYTYKITDEGEIHIFKDDERTNDVLVSVDINGSYIFQSKDMLLAEVLLKVKGEKGMLSGGYRIVDGDTVKYELLFLKDGYELPAPQEQQLVLGENTIIVNDAVNGTVITYKAEFNGDLTINQLTGETNASVYLITNGTQHEIQMPSVITVSAGQTLELVVKTADGCLDEIELQVKFEKKTGVFEDEEV